MLRAQRRRAAASDASKGSPPLRVVVMSATLDVALFERFFDPPVACVRVPGRQHAVEVLYALEPEDDFVDAALCTVMQLHDEQPLGGDILAFLPGQEQIEALANMIAAQLKRARGAPANTALVCPLYAALPREAQERAFAPAPRGARKIIIATTIAETSLTIAGVQYVVDSGQTKVGPDQADEGNDKKKDQAHQGKSQHQGKTFAFVLLRQGFASM